MCKRNIYCECDIILDSFALLSMYKAPRLPQLDNSNPNKTQTVIIFNIIFYKESRYFSASNAAIAPVPAEVIAWR